MVHALSLGLTLLATWLLLSGVYEPLYIGFGVVSCVICVFLARRMDVVDHESMPIHLTYRYPTYLIWLIKEIVVANVDVTRAILMPRMPIQPQVIRAKATQHNELGKVIYANSITLTPGTITMDIDGDEFTVHALTDGSAGGVLDGGMDRRVTALEPRA
ncbi:MAG: Na+/H+ antiporter subunit E [Alphaproteobacteria bacterium]